MRNSLQKVVVVAWLLGACAAGSTPGAATSPTPVRPPVWIELTSEHFTVWTDSTPEQARALVRTMEHLRQVILGVSFFTWPDVPAASRRHVQALLGHDDAVADAVAHKGARS